jgi:hypothetical protein
MCRDSRIIPGSAATEIELAKKLKEFSLKETGYVIFSWIEFIIEGQISLDCKLVSSCYLN